jgi:hypothetical protein
MRLDGCCIATAEARDPEALEEITISLSPRPSLGAVQLIGRSSRFPVDPYRELTLCCPAIANHCRHVRVHQSTRLLNEAMRASHDRRGRACTQDEWELPAWRASSRSLRAA